MSQNIAVSQEPDESGEASVSVLDPSHISRTYTETSSHESVDSQQSRYSRKKIHFEIKVDVRLSRETVDEVERIAGYLRRSKSETIRGIIEDGVESFRKDPSYRRYLKRVAEKQRMRNTGTPE